MRACPAHRAIKKPATSGLFNSLKVAKKLGRDMPVPLLAPADK